MRCDHLTPKQKCFQLPFELSATDDTGIKPINPSYFTIVCAHRGSATC